MSYIVEQYPADGDLTPFPRTYHATLAEARARVRHLLGVSRLSAARRWPGYTEEPGLSVVEAYHERVAGDPRAYGCGGVGIYRSTT